MTKIGLLSVNVAQPETIGLRRGKPVISGIRKRPVDSDSITIGRTNIAGDAQGDLRVHGGPDKAIYAYPSEHLPWWTEELEREPPFGPGAFGENLSTIGVLETDVCIGDRWRWGSAELQICQPRYPCFKLMMATEQKDMVTRFLASRRSGWYLRVLVPGEARRDEEIEVIERDSHGVTVREAAEAVLPGADPARAARVRSIETLAASWRRMAGEDH